MWQRSNHAVPHPGDPKRRNAYVAMAQIGVIASLCSSGERIAAMREFMYYVSIPRSSVTLVSAKATGMLDACLIQDIVEDRARRSKLLNARR